MSAAAGAGPIKVSVDDLPDGWEAFSTLDGEKYFCFPQVYYYCKALGKVQWQKPDWDDAQDPYDGPLIGGMKPFEEGDQYIPDPPAQKPDETPYSDANYVASLEDITEEPFQADEDMLEACLAADLDKLKASLGDGADCSLPNVPWQNTPLHLVCCHPHWDAETLRTERQARLDMAKYLVNQGADLEALNIYHFKPIDLALAHGYDDIVTFLQAQGTQMGWFGAAIDGNLDRIKELLAEGADIDLQGRYGRTAFFEAKLMGHFKVECFLAQQGCDKKLSHSPFLKFSPGGGALPRGVAAPKREKQYHRIEQPEWYNDMMGKRYADYHEKMSHLAREYR